MHRDLLIYSEEDAWHRGNYKTTTNSVVAFAEDGKQLGVVFATATPFDTPSLMAELITWFNAERQAGQLHPLLLIGLCIVVFLEIHPFQDGNGRIGRMMICLMAVQTGLTKLPLLHISSILEKQKDTYIERLFKVSTHGEWAGWLNFFLEVVRQSCISATKAVDQVITLQADLKQRALSNDKNHRLPTIIDALFEKEWTTAAEVQKLCGTTFPTAQKDIQELVRMGILSHFAGSTRPAIYIAIPIWDLSRR